jgi:hypothetical protein
MPPGIIKDPSQSPCIINRADARKNKKLVEPTTIVGYDLSKEFEAGTYVIFKVVPRTITVSYVDQGISKTVNLKMDVAVDIKKKNEVDKEEWDLEWIEFADKKLRDEKFKDWKK